MRSDPGAPPHLLRPTDDQASAPDPGRSLPLALLGTAVGLGLLLLGARLVVSNAVSLATLWGVPNRVVGLTIVGIGTSLPELATSVVATYQGRTEVAIGNVLGSNVFNALGILGTAALVSPIEVPAGFLTLDGPMALAVALLLAGLMWTDRQLSRVEGGLLLAIALGYTVSLGF